MIKRFMMMVVMFVMLGGIANAVTVTNPLWMVSSKAAMLSYAKARASSGYVGVSSGASVNEMNSTNYAYVNLSEGVYDLRSIQSCLKTQTVSFAVARPSTDYISISECVYDRNGCSLFFASNYGQLEKNGVSWSVPSSMMTLDLQLSSSIFIVITNAVSAKLILRDDDGNVVQNERRIS